MVVNEIPLNQLNIRMIATLSVFQEDKKYYAQVYLHEFGYEFVNEL